MGDGAAKRGLELLCAVDFGPGAHGFRPRRSEQQALERLRRVGNPGANHGLDADRSPPSREREIRPHGLNGDVGFVTDLRA